MKSLIQYLINSFIQDINVPPEEVHNEILTVPNIITMIGIVLTALYILQFTYDFWIWFIPFNIILISISDLLDGYFATQLNQHSWVGKFIDGFRDRFVGFAILLHMAMAFSDIVTYALIGILLIFESANSGIIVCLNYHMMRDQKVFNVHMINKMRQAVHLSCGFLFVVQVSWWEQVIVKSEWLLLLMIFVSVITMFKSFHALIVFFGKKCVT